MSVFVDTDLTQHCKLSKANHKHSARNLPSTLHLSQLTHRTPKAAHYLDGHMEGLSYLLEVTQGSLRAVLAHFWAVETQECLEILRRVHLPLTDPSAARGETLGTWRAAETEKPTRPALR